MSTQQKKKEPNPNIKIDIQFPGSNNNFSIGDVIRGKIIVVQTKECLASEVQVGIYGCELTYFWLSQSSDSAAFQGKQPFVF